jgi:hypothetical protein
MLGETRLTLDADWLTESRHLLDGHSPLIIAAGLVVACGVAVFGVRLSRHRRSAVHASLSESLALDWPGSTGDPFVYGGSREKRTAPRRRGSQVAVRIATADGNIRTYDGLVVDRSIGGLAIEVRDPVGVGEIMSIRPAHAAPMIPWVQLQVRHLRQIEGGWIVGCQFVQVPPSSVIWQFG